MTAVINARILQGNCLQILPEMAPESVDMILTDPPYAINYQSNRRVSKPKFDHIDGDLPGDWIESFAHEAYRILKRNRHLYCFCRHDTYPLFCQAFTKAGFTLKRTLIWIKNNHGSGDLKGDYAPMDEWIIFAQKGRRRLFGNRSNNILQYNKVHSGSLLHPTQKPVDLLRFLIEKSTEKGEIILDPYAGVFSTALAAIETDRSTIGIELNREYFEKGITRLSAQPKTLEDSSIITTK